MFVLYLLSAAGGLLCAAAAWAALWSPRAKAMKTDRDQRAREQREVHEALFGVPERRDDAGALIQGPQPGLLADMRIVTTKLSAPLLNGKGDDLLVTVDRLDRTTKRLDDRSRKQAAEIRDIKNSLCDGAQ